MGCINGREKGEVHEQQKWDYITLSDFKGRSCGAILSYMWLWILVLITIGVYVADTFTAVKLLVFDQWSSEIKPAIPFIIAKWIFAGCIILSWTLAIFAWINAYRVMRRRCVTDDYLNSTAVELQSIRPGGWKRFLVFAALTKSKKKVSWIALYVYFQRQGAIRLLAAEAPRQVVNALTLLAVGKAKFLDPGKGADRSGFDQFWYNFQVFAEKNKMQAVIICTMAYTLVIWVISFLMLLLALILYIMFLWHYIQNETLSGFCRRKVETRLARIVKKKGDKELARQAKKWEKIERKHSPSGSVASALPPKLAKQPTLPMMGSSPPQETALFRSDSSTTLSTLPPYTSQTSIAVDGRPPNLSRAPTLPDLSNRPQLTRPGTGMSDISMSSDAPLLSQAGTMGYSDPSRPPPMNRSFTGSTQRSMAPGFGPSSLNRSFTGDSQRSMMSNGQGRPPLPPLSTQQTDPRYPPPSRSNTSFSATTGRVSPMSARTNNYTPMSAQSDRPLLHGQTPITPYDNRMQSPAQGMAYEMTPVESRGYNAGKDYFSQAPQRAPTLPMMSPESAPTPSSLQIGRRDMSAPMPPRQPPPSGALPWPPTQRSATAPMPNYSNGAMQRSHTAGPQGGPQPW